MTIEEVIADLAEEIAVLRTVYDRHHLIELMEAAIRVLQEAAAEIERLQRDLAVGVRQRQNDAEDFLRREGYRACDIPACNCGSWHKERVCQGHTKS